MRVLVCVCVCLIVLVCVRVWMCVVCARHRTSSADHELNEALGEVLTPKIPPGTQALLMPDGKAQAFLHVLGTRACVCIYVWDVYVHMRTRAWYVVLIPCLRTSVCMHACVYVYMASCVCVYLYGMYVCVCVVCTFERVVCTSV